MLRLYWVHARPWPLVGRGAPINFVPLRSMRLLHRLPTTLLLLVAALAVAVPMRGAAARAVTPEDELQDEARMVEALFSLIQFTSWRGPLSLTDRVTVCTVGADPLGRVLDNIAGRSTRGRPIAVRRFSDPASARGCHVVFVGPTMRRSMGSVLRRLRGSGALTVGAFPDFARRGGMVRLTETAERVNLEVNREALAREGVRLSSRVLQIAHLL